MRFLHITDTHFGDPPRSVGLKLTAGGLRAAVAQVVQQRIVTVMATHDPAVVNALEAFVALVAPSLDGIFVSGDAATTGSNTDLALASAALWRIRKRALRPCYIVPGNHDRFGPPLTYRPGSTAFERHFTPLASPFSHGCVVDDSCLIAGIDLTLPSLAGTPGWGRRLGLGRACAGAVTAFRDAVIALAARERVSHIIVVTHFPVQIGRAMPENHRVLDADLFRQALRTTVDETKLPTLVLSGHLHREYFVRQAVRRNLWHYTGRAATKQYRTVDGRPILVDRNSCAIIETTDGGFSVQRYDYDGRPGRFWFAPHRAGPRVPKQV